jgi:hypothetical protein
MLRRKNLSLVCRRMQIATGVLLLLISMGIVAQAQDVWEPAGGGLSGIFLMNKIYIDDVGDIDSPLREAILTITFENRGGQAIEWASCPMIHMHCPGGSCGAGDPGDLPQAGTQLCITPTGGQRPCGPYNHPGRTYRYPLPVFPGRYFLKPGDRISVNYEVFLADLVPPANGLTRARIRQAINAHGTSPAAATVYTDSFFNFRSGVNFQCPNGTNTFWCAGPCVDAPAAADYTFNWFSFTHTDIVPVPPKYNLPLTIHTSETIGRRMQGNPINAYLQITPQCRGVECSPTPCDKDCPDGFAPSGKVLWRSDPMPGEKFTPLEEDVGDITLFLPRDLPEGAILRFDVTMLEVDTNRHLSGEVVRVAKDTIPPNVLDANVNKRIEGNKMMLTVNAMISDNASSISFVQVKYCQPKKKECRGKMMQYVDGDYLEPTSFTAELGPFELDEELEISIDAYDEADNVTSVTPKIVP